MPLPNVPKDENMPEAVRGWLERAKRAIESSLSSIGALVIPSPATGAEAAAGTSDDTYLSPLTGLAAISTFASLKNFALFREVQNNNVDGGNPPSGTGQYNIRTLNTTVFDTIGTSLSSNQVTIPAGRYVVLANCVTFRTGRTSSRLYNVTDSSVILRGSGHRNNDTSVPDTLNTWIYGQFEVSATKAIRLETYITNNPGSGVAMGIAINIGEPEIYSQLLLWKVT